MPDEGQDQINTWGKINQGQDYALVARDLVRAMASVRLSHDERQLLGEAIEQSYQQVTRKGKVAGQWPDPKPWKPNISALARTLHPSGWRNKRAYLQKAKGALVRDRILIEQPDGSLLINKHADEWAAHRITAAELEHAREAQKWTRFRVVNRQVKEGADDG